MLPRTRLTRRPHAPHPRLSVDSGLVVDAAEGVEANAQDVLEESGQVFADVECRPGLKRHLDRERLHLRAQAPCEVEGLDVEGERIDRRAAEDRSRHLATERLESTLAVADVGQPERASTDLYRGSRQQPEDAALLAGVGPEAALAGRDVGTVIDCRERGRCELGSQSTDFIAKV